MSNITTIIVTYNREKLILRCLSAVLNQNVKSQNIIIVNNHSTDNTINEIKRYFGVEENIEQEEEFLKISTPLFEKVNIYLYNKTSNTGGAGGFSCGMELATKNLSYDFLWMMDDDGYPEVDCLQKLVQCSEQNKYGYLMPVSINIDNHSQLSWPIRKKNKKKTVDYDELKKSWGSIINYVTPFNGILLSRDCVKKAGYVNKNFFIWGDDYEHYYRCIKNGFTPKTYLDAVFFHPAQKVSLVPICFGLFHVAYVESPLRMVCIARNWTYIYLHYNMKYRIIIKFLMYLWLFLITRHGDFNGLKLYYASVKDGFKGDFSRHLKYLN